MDQSRRESVRVRAGNRCEYCQLSQAQSPFAKLQIEHVRPRQHGGNSEIENLALACIDCNLHKGPNIAGIDGDTEQLTPLFDPRKDRWEDHFKWWGIRIIGISPIGRVTVTVMDMNSDERLEVRLAWR